MWAKRSFIFVLFSKYSFAGQVKVDESSRSIMQWYREERVKGFHRNIRKGVRFEVLMVGTMKNAAYLDVTSCVSCKNRRFGGTSRLNYHGDTNRCF
jgi:hypothetical protein